MQFLASDRTPKGVDAICEKVYPLLYGTAEVDENTKPVYVERRVVAEWDGWTGEWEYVLSDGRVVVESRDVDDEGVSATVWHVYTPAAVEV